MSNRGLVIEPAIRPIIMSMLHDNERELHVYVV